MSVLLHQLKWRKTIFEIEMKKGLITIRQLTDKIVSSVHNFVKKWEFVRFKVRYRN